MEKYVEFVNAFNGSCIEKRYTRDVFVRVA